MAEAQCNRSRARHEAPSEPRVDGVEAAREKAGRQALKQPARREGRQTKLVTR